MMTTQAYMYHQRHEVILLDTSGAIFERRLRQVYTRDLIAHRGTDNQLLIQFLNQDQKRVNLTKTVAIGDPVPVDSLVPGQLYCITEVGDTDWTLVGAVPNCPYIEGTKFTATSVGTGTGTATPIEAKDLEFTVRLISHDGTGLVLEKPLEMVNRAQGQTKIVLTESELDLIAPGKVGFSIEQTADGQMYEPVYVDDNAGGRGIINVVDSIMPSFVSSSTLTIPEGQPGPSYVTSILNTNDADLHTFQLDLDQFVGDVLVEGASDIDGLWYTIQTETLALATDLHLFNVEGYHPYIRLTFTPTSGSVIEIRIR